MNKISDAKVKQLLGQAKDDEIQTRLNRLRKKIDKSDDNNNNTTFYDSDVDEDDDDNNNDGRDELRWRYNNLRRLTTIPIDNDEKEILHRYNNLKPPPNSEEELLGRYNDLRTPLFREIPPSSPLSLRRPDIEKEYDGNLFKTSTKPHCWGFKNRFWSSYNK